jgi:SNF2 family DNA or RNA helicase
MSDIEEYSEKVRELRSSIESLDSEYDTLDEEVRELSVQMNDLRSRLEMARNKKQTAYFAKTNAHNDLDVAERGLSRARMEAREKLQKEPDVTNPPLERILGEIADWPEWKKLRDYQKADLILTWDRFLRPEVTGQWGVFNANDTSLGKTAETALTIRGLRVLFPNAPALWLTKTTLVKSSARQCKEWGLNVIPLIGTTDVKVSMMNFMGETLRGVGMPETYITNYEALNTALFNEILTRDWLVVAVDEMHRLRGGANAGGPTKMWLALKKLLHGTDSLRVVALPQGQAKMTWNAEADVVIREDGRPFPIFMSGSLINNGSEEVWAYTHLFNPVTFPSRAHFKRTFMAAYSLGISIELIMRVISANFFRKTKKEIGLFMHDKIYQEHYIEMTPGSDLWNFQKQVMEDFMIKLDELGDEMVSIAGILAELHYGRVSLVAEDFNVSVPIRDSNGFVVKDSEGKVLKKKVLKHLNGPLSKLDYCAEHVFEMVQAEGENVLIFSGQFNSPIAYLQDRFREMGLTVESITGDSRLTTRDVADIEKDFQDNKIQVLLINMGKGAEGLNLHKDKRWEGGASNVVLLDRWYNPQRNLQAEDRAWRLDCLEPVTIHRYIIDGTADNIVDGICTDKLLEAEGLTEHTSLRAAEWRSKIASWLDSK